VFLPRAHAWVRDVPRGFTRTSGGLQILGAAGLIPRAITGVLPWLTPPVAAYGRFVVVPF